MDVNIVSDWESKFTSTFQKAFRKALGTKIIWVHLITVDILSVREDYSELKGYVQRLCGMEFRKASTYTRVCLHRQLSFEPYSIPLCWTKVGEQYELELLMVQETVEQRTYSRIGFRKPMTSENLCS
ncbi:hypothetical protein YC2023_019830 [Brassica napus]